MEKEKLPEVISANDIQIVEPSPMAMAQAFLTAGGDLDTLKEMMSLQREHDAYQAKKAYHKAMAAFKKNPPVIGKDKHVAYKTTRYSHASLGNVTKQINMALGEHGLSAAWPLEQSNNGIKVTCVITHEMGHSESTSLTAGADSTGTKNGIQAMGSTISYLQRYTILALTGLATEDQDNDGQTEGPVQYISTDQAIEITDKLAETKGNKDMFLKNFGADSIETIPAAQYGRALSMLKAKAGAA